MQKLQFLSFDTYLTARGSVGQKGCH